MSYQAPEATQVGHVHLKVADLDRAIAFYSGILGFSVMARIGNKAAFLGAGGYHHHIGLNTWESEGATPPPKGHTGLYHSAFLYPKRADLAKAVKRVMEAGITLDGMSDHSVSEAIYLRDPDENGVELYWDRPRDLWITDDKGHVSLATKRLDLNDLLKEVASQE